MCLKKPATKEFPYWLYRVNYFRNMLSETCHNMLRRVCCRSLYSCALYKSCTLNQTDKVWLVSMKCKCPVRKLRDFGWTLAILRRIAHGAYSERPTLPLVEEDTWFPNVQKALKRIKFGLWFSKGQENKVENSGGGQWQCILLDWRFYTLGYLK